MIDTAAGSFVQRAPVLFQETNGTRREVMGRLVRRGEALGFEVGPYDRSRSLVIDPAYERVSYLGGRADEDLSDLAVDAAGKAYVVGTTTSPAFNEARRLPATLARLREHLAEVPVVWRSDAATRVSLGGGGTAFLDLLRIRASAMRGHYGPAGGGPPT